MLEFSVEKFKIGVIVTSNLGEKSPEARGANGALEQRGLEAFVLEAGRYFQLEINAETREEAEVMAQGISEKLLTNPIYQSFQILPPADIPCKDQSLS